MGFFWTASVFGLTAILVGFAPYYFKKSPPLIFGGHVKPGFEKVLKVFEQSFKNGWELEGAAFAAYYKGELVADIWGGYADAYLRKTWKEDTLTVVFSSTKGMAAIVAAMCVDRGFMSYDDLVIKHWPEFGKNGKDQITIKTLLSHRAGLATFDQKISIESVRDWKKMSKLIEDQKPLWTPGEAGGYHAVTFGWLVDQLVRRVDPKRRSVGEFFKEEIADKFNIDFHIKFPPEIMPRLARVRMPTFDQVLQRITDRKFASFYIGIMYNLIADKNSLIARVANNPDWMLSAHEGWQRVNDPEVLSVEIASVTGTGNARSLAKVFQLLNDGKLINKTLLEYLVKNPVTVNEVDLVFGVPFTIGHGFFFNKSPTGSVTIGHSGYGGQQAKLDVDNEISFSYVTNGLGPDINELHQRSKLVEISLYECVEKFKKA